MPRLETFLFRCFTQHSQRVLLPEPTVFVFLQVGLNVLIGKAGRFNPTTRMLVQRFIPFPAVGAFRSYSHESHESNIHSGDVPVSPFVLYFIFMNKYYLFKYLKLYVINVFHNIYHDINCVVLFYIYYIYI